MPSAALQALQLSLMEIRALQRANSSPTGAAPTRPDVTRAIGRASIVLLSSHLERYIRSVNEEAVLYINTNNMYSRAIPDIIKLRNHRGVIDGIAQTQWGRRSDQLRQLMAADASIWRDEETVSSLSHEHILDWMSAPHPRELRRYYQLWGIADIFSAITHKPHTRSSFYLRIGELVEKRNNIAHGDFQEQATQRDINEYISSVELFCVRADRTYARRLGRIFGGMSPW